MQEDQILFSPDEAQRLFGEAGVLFHGQIKKDFQQLITFNRAITEERRHKKYVATHDTPLCEAPQHIVFVDTAIFESR